MKKFQFEGRDHIPTKKKKMCEKCFDVIGEFRMLWGRRFRAVMQLKVEKKQQQHTFTDK